MPQGKVLDALMKHAEVFFFFTDPLSCSLFTQSTPIMFRF
jgi:hypothetical protein